MKSIFNIDDYEIKRFNKKQGLSGKLYLATNRADKNDRWVIKNEDLDHVLNEFVISTFANELNILMPECRLGKYKGRVSVFIKFISNLRFLNREEAIKDAYIYEDYLKQIFIADIFYNDDYREIYLDDKNQVWQIDNAMGGIDGIDSTMYILRKSKTDNEVNKYFNHLLNAMEKNTDEYLSYAIENVIEHEIGRVIVFNTLLDIIKLDEESINNKNINEMFETIAGLKGEDSAKLSLRHGKGERPADKTRRGIESAQSADV